ncbi:MAG: BMP family ABC transporter substrate-binding protein [Clostridia bacterium]|nr:BMP family ABC transporter substrate-binding protein [Clostridia bacterium]
MSLVMATEQYSRARKLALKEYHARMQRGEQPYLPALDEIEADHNALAHVPLRLIQIPLNKVVGTVSRGRTNAFAANFMPIIETGSEFSHKWCELFDSVVEEGLRQPIKAVEYMNQYYLIEGNKRVSVMKYLKSPSIEGEVTRILPRRTDEIENRIYFEFLDFNKDTGVNFIWFSETGGFEKLYRLTGTKPGEKWDTDARRHFEAIYMRFRNVYKSMGGDRIKITTGDAFLTYLEICGYEGAFNRYDQEIKTQLRALWQEFERDDHEENVALIMQPDEMKKSGGILNSLFGPNIVKVAFLYNKPPEQSGWIYWHDLGRVNLENAVGERVRTTVCICENPDKFDDEIERLINEGNDIIFTTSPVMLKDSMKASVKYPGAKVLNCSLLASWKRVRSYYLRIYEAKYLLGMIAGALADNDKIGYVADYPIYGMASSINAFALGARAVNPRAKVYLEWSMRKGFNPEDPFGVPDVNVVSSRDVGSPRYNEVECGLYTIRNGEKKNIAIPVFDWSRIYVSLVRSVLNGTWKEDDEGTGVKAMNFWWGLSSGAIDVIMSKRVQPGTKRLVDLVREHIRDGSFFVFEGQIKSQDGVERCAANGRLSPADVITMDWLADNVVGSFPGLREIKDEAKALVELQGIREIKQPDASWFSWRADEQ